MNTQLQDFLEEKERRLSEVESAKKVITSQTASKAEKAAAAKKIKWLRTAIEELNTQIYHLDPSFLKKGKARKGLFDRALRVPLDYNSDGRSFSERVGYEDENIASLFTTSNDSPSKQREYLLEGVSMISPQWAKVLTLRVSEGLTFNEISNRMGYKTDPKYVGMAWDQYYRALKRIRRWMEIRTVVDICALYHPFDWDKFLTDLDILPASLNDLLICLIDSTNTDWHSPSEIGRYLGWSEGMVKESRRELSLLRHWLEKLRIPKEEIDAVHPFLAMVKPRKTQTDEQFMKYLMRHAYS